MWTSGDPTENTFSTIIVIENFLIIIIGPIIFFFCKKNNIEIDSIISLYIALFQIVLGGIVFIITDGISKLLVGLGYGLFSTILIFIFIALAGLLGETFVGNIIYLVLICILLIFLLFLFLRRKKAKYNQ